MAGLLKRATGMPHHGARLISEQDTRRAVLTVQADRQHQGHSYWGFSGDFVHSNKPNLMVHMRVLQVAVRYQVEGLKELAFDEFTVEACTFWNRDDFADALQVLVWSGNCIDERLTDIACQVLCQHRELLQDETVQELLQSNNLAYDLLMYQEKIGMERVIALSELSLYPSSRW